MQTLQLVAVCPVDCCSFHGCWLYIAHWHLTVCLVSEMTTRVCTCTVHSDHEIWWCWSSSCDYHRLDLLLIGSLVLKSIEAELCLVATVQAECQHTVSSSIRPTSGTCHHYSKLYNCMRVPVMWCTAATLKCNIFCSACSVTEQCSLFVCVSLTGSAGSLSQSVSRQCNGSQSTSLQSFPTLQRQSCGGEFCHILYWCSLRICWWQSYGKLNVFSYKELR